MSDALFTPRFFIMCAFSFIVFVSIFQLLPTAPYQVIAIGGSTTSAGLFLGLLTYASACSAPLTGHIGDRIGQRRVLLTVSLVLAVCTASYAVVADPRVMLTVVVVHGLFWSALLSASGAYMTATIPPARRAEGLGYWGLASVVAIAVAPALGFWVYRRGWVALCAELAALNLLMAAVAWRLPDDRDDRHHRVDAAADAAHAETTDEGDRRPSRLPRIEWEVMLLAVGMALVSFGYGGLTSFSALFADELGVSPRSLFLTVMAVAILSGRLTLGRRLDRVGHRRVLVPAFVVSAMGLVVLAVARSSTAFLASAAIFGAGFGLMYPACAAYLMNRTPPARRGAAFGAMIAAFDTGIGTGSSTLGWLIARDGFRVAFGAAAAVALLAAPYFLLVEHWMTKQRRGSFLRKA